MKKALIIAAAASVLWPCGPAPALDTFVGPYSMQISGLGASMGSAAFAALGREGNDCRYLMTWWSPFNPNAAELCDVRERWTPVYPSCIDNRAHDFTTFVQAGPAAIVSTACSGFDNLGEAFDDMSLLLGESTSRLQGTVILPWGLTYPIEIARREGPASSGQDKDTSCLRREATSGRFSQLGRVVRSPTSPRP